MADFESFNPGEGGEAYDPAAFERFKEKVKKNAAFIAAVRKGEQKQKVKEDRLAKILLKFIQSNQKSALLMLAAKLLQENIPASFILSIILLGNEEVQMELKKEAQADLPKLAAGESSAISTISSEFSIVTAFSDQSLPLKLKAEIDSWGKGILESGSAAPFRVLETALDSTGAVKKIIIDCCANVLGDFMANNSDQELGYETFYSFCEFLMKGVMRHLQKQVENQKELN
ncbi:hypothetical protein HZA42_05665 [Candidatus Peregrinibacteria bacterium]|nr:hypothetical protein [Candidatus Peregrinibacteria bacterium]